MSHSPVNRVEVETVEIRHGQILRCSIMAVHSTVNREGVGSSPTVSAMSRGRLSHHLTYVPARGYVNNF